MDHPGTIRLDPRRVRAARERRGLSRKDLAAGAEPGLAISEATIKRAEKGQALLLGKARILARLLAVDLEALLPGEAGAVAEAPPPWRTRSDPEPRPARHPEGVRPPMADPPLVGRDAELARFDEALERCLAGRPTLLVLEGEAGVGKTRLLREGLARFQRHGGLGCFGQGHEGGVFPFQPWQDALGPRARQLGWLEGEDGPLLERFLDPRGAAAGPSVAAGQGDQSALFRAVARRLLDAPQPMLLVLDDLQWVDGGSLTLLEQVALMVSQAAELGGRSRLLCVASHRREGLPERTAAVLERIAREPGAAALRLGPLGPEPTHELVRALGLDPPAQQLVSAIFETTGGNPLFVRAIVDLLYARGDIQTVGGTCTTRVDPRDLGLPRTLTAAVEARLASLPDRVRSVLDRAAFLGGRFDLPKLAFVLEEDEDAVLDVLETAVREGFLRNDAGQRFVFSHPLVRHALQHGFIAARRQRIHREIAERLEAWFGAEADRNACEIADHWIHAGPVAPTESLLRFVRRAAEQALDGCAWEDAARFGEAALELGRERGVLSDLDAAELHRRTGVAHHLAWDVGPGLAHYDAAAGTFERVGDEVGRARALNDRVRLADNAGLVAYGDHGDAESLERALAALGEREPILRGRILDTLAMVYATAREPERAESLAVRALEIGEREEDEDLCAQVSTSLAFAHLQRLRLQAARDRWREGARHAAAAGNEIRVGRCLQRLTLMHLALGDLDDARDVGEEAWSRTHTILSGESAMPRGGQAAERLLRGDVREAERMANQAAAILRRHRYAWAGTSAFPLLAQVRLLRGDASGALDAIATMASPGVVYEDPAPLERSVQRYRWLIEASRGSPHRTREVAASLSAQPPRAPSRGRLDLAAVNRLGVEVELAYAVGLPRLAAHAADPLRLAVERGVRVTTAWVQLVPRVAGLAAAAAGRFDEAARHLLEAEDWAERQDAPLELARTWLDHAWVLGEQGGATEVRRARERVRAALRSFESQGLPREAERAERLAAELGA